MTARLIVVCSRWRGSWRQLRLFCASLLNIGRVAQALSQLTPKERKRLAKAMKRLTPEQRSQLEGVLKRRLEGQKPAQHLIPRTR